MTAPVPSGHVDVDDLATIDLSDEFIERNMNKELENDFSQRTLQRVCDEFVHSFLVEHGAWITSLHASLGQCDTVLEDVESVLQNFIEQLESIQRDIGDVRGALATKTTELDNTRRAEALLWATVSRLVVPPEVVQVVTQSNEAMLGTQFKMCVTVLLRCLRFRSGSWIDDRALGSAVDGDDGSSRPTIQESLEEVRTAFINCQVYRELMNVIDALTVYACVKIKAFLSNKLGVLTAPNTNVSIQQEHSLKQYSFYVHFLKSAVPLLRHAHSGGQQGEKQSTLVPFRIARALYSEFKAEYCVVMSNIYLQKLQDYAFACNGFEFNTSTVTSTSFFGGMASGAGSESVVPKFVYQLPTIADATSTAGFVLGERGNIIRHLFDAPLIPTVEIAKNRKHSYEETFRSLISLVCDMVTHEYLFTFRFFSGDMSVYVDVFKPTIQFVVDYVAEIILTRAEGNVKRLMLSANPGATVNTNAKKDCYGLLLLICMCRQYRSMMKFTRKLSCLDGFFDSILVLLWPAFKITYDQQLVSLRCTNVDTQLSHMASRSRLQDKLSCVHPLVEAYTELTCTLTSLCLGTTITEEWRMEAALARERTDETSAGHTSGETSDEHSTQVAFRTLQEQALSVIRGEEEEDTADCASHFSVLLGNLAFLRVEVTHMLHGMAAKLIANEPNAELRRVLTPLQCVFLLNNLWFMLSRFSQFPITVAGEEETVTVGQYGDLKALQDAYEACRSEFVTRLLTLYFPQFDRLLGRADQLPWQDVEKEADSFLANWKRSIDAMRATTRSLIGERAHEQDILAQACTDCILFNSRFHAAIASCVENNPESFKDRPLRSLTVSNQVLLQHMRTFATVDSGNV